MVSHTQSSDESTVNKELVCDNKDVRISLRTLIGAFFLSLSFFATTQSLTRFSQWIRKGVKCIFYSRVDNVTHRTKRNDLLSLEICLYLHTHSYRLLDLYYS